MVHTVIAEARAGFDEDIQCAGTVCTCREEVILICAAIKMVDMTGGDEEAEIKTWIEDFKRYLRGIS